jgi:hypothetical protein
MTCSECSSEHQHGRFCIRCGSKRPLPSNALLVRRLPATSRTDGVPRTGPVRARPDTAPHRSGGRRAPSPTDTDRPERPDENTVRGMYDFALARAGSPGERSLDRYLSVLLRTSRSA